MADPRAFDDQRSPRAPTFAPPDSGPSLDGDHAEPHGQLQTLEIDGAQSLSALETPTVKAPRARTPSVATHRPQIATPIPVTTALRPTPRVIGTVGTVLLLLVVNLLVQINRRSWDIRSDGYWAIQRVQQCESLGRVPDVLFLGSSRVVYGVNTPLVDSIVNTDNGSQILSCNAGMFGSTFEQDYYTFKRFVEDGYVPKVLVEDLREYNLNAHAAETADNNGLAWAQTLPLLGVSDARAIASHYGGAKGIAESANFVAGQLIPVYGDRIGLYQAACQGSAIGPCGADLPNAGALAIARYKQSDRQGWVPLNGVSIATLTPAQVKQRAVELQQFEGGQLQDFAIGGQQPTYLARMIELAQEHGVRVALTVSPLNSTFFTLFNRPSDWPVILAYWRSFAKAHGAAYFDESHPAGFTDADWYDSEHLNASGADKRAALLAHDVVEPLLTPSP